MALISQDDHLTAGASADCGDSLPTTQHLSFFKNLSPLLKYIDSIVVFLSTAP